jgi:hypothetical protein
MLARLKAPTFPLKTEVSEISEARVTHAVTHAAPIKTAIR